MKQNGMERKMIHDLSEIKSLKRNLNTALKETNIK